MRKTLSVIAACAGALGASADAMYWLVDQPSGAASSIEFAYASMVSDGTKLYEDEDGGSYFMSLNGLSTGEDPNGAQLGESPDQGVTYDGYESFYFELYDDAFKVVGRSDTYYFANMLGYIWGSGEEPKEKNNLVVDHFNSVPEPTGGMLLLVGLAGLALRRKNGSRTVASADAAGE